MAKRIKIRGDDESPHRKRSSGHTAKKTAILRNIAKKLDAEDDANEDEKEVTESIFYKHLKRIKRAEKEGLKGEALDLMILKSFRTLVQDLIPVAEDTYRKWPTHLNGSALNHYINQEREIINDIRALEDFRSRAGFITNIITEEFQGIAKKFIDNTTKLKSDLKDRSTNIEDQFKTYLKLFGRELNTANDRIGDRVMEFLVSNDKK